jgi:hypothetical protein
VYVEICRRLPLAKNILAPPSFTLGGGIRPLAPHEEEECGVFVTGLVL